MQLQRRQDRAGGRADDAQRPCPRLELERSCTEGDVQRRDGGECQPEEPAQATEGDRAQNEEADGADRHDDATDPREDRQDGDARGPR